MQVKLIELCYVLLVVMLWIIVVDNNFVNFQIITTLFRCDSTT